VPHEVELAHLGERGPLGTEVLGRHQIVEFGGVDVRIGQRPRAASLTRLFDQKWEVLLGTEAGGPFQGTR
jgi:hypothetical protein